MVSCCVSGCDVTHRNNPDNCTFHRFPLDPLMREKWLSLIGRVGWNPNKYSTICSKHFADKYKRRRSVYTILLKGSVPIFLYQFPSEPDVKNKWIEATGKKNWSPTKFSRICSVHFNEGSFKETNKFRRLTTKAIPTIDVLNLTNNETSQNVGTSQNTAVKTKKSGKESKGSNNDSTNDDCPLDEDSSQSAQAVDDKYLHAGIVCKICAKKIRGFRYTCVQCAEFDMCSACEALQAHAAHYVLRVPAHRPLWEVSEMLERVRAQVAEIQPKGFQEPEIYKPEIKIEFESDPLKELKEEPCYRPHSSNMLEQSLVSLELFEVKEEPLCAESERADDAPTTADLEAAPAGQPPPAPAPRVAKRKLPPAASQKQQGQTKKIAKETKQDTTLLNQLPSTSQVEQTPTALTDDQHLSRVADDSGGAFQFEVYSHNTAAPATQTQTHAHTQNVIHSTTAKGKGGRKKS